MSVALTVVASAPPTNDDAAALKTAVATALAVAEDTVKNFVVAVAGAARRWLHSADSARRALATTYEWDVSFTVTADLNNQTEPTDFGASVNLSPKTKRNKNQKLILALRDSIGHLPFLKAAVA